jgi:CheY-like chemotaxis protein
VILDVNMPVLGGQEAFLEMRALRPGLKAIFASGQPVEDAGFGDLIDGKQVVLLQKPFLPSEIATAVQALLEGR